MLAICSSPPTKRIELTDTVLEVEDTLYRFLNIIYDVDLSGPLHFLRTTHLIELGRKYDCVRVEQVVHNKVQVKILKDRGDDGIDLFNLALYLGDTEMAMEEFSHGLVWMPYDEDGKADGEVDEECDIETLLERHPELDTCVGNALMWDLGAASLRVFRQIPPNVVWCILRASRIHKGSKLEREEEYGPEWAEIRDEFERLMGMLCKLPGFGYTSTEAWQMEDHS